MAQEASLKIDMVGLIRRKVQVIMRDYSFSEYKKDHVTYVLDPNVAQRINYSADTCSSIVFMVGVHYSEVFEKKLILATDSFGTGYQKELVDRLTHFSITQRVRPAVVTRTKKKKREKNQHDFSVAEIPSKEREAADEGYFKIQKRTESDNQSHVKVLGWNKGEGQ